jgi:DNA-binding transcriptional MerR regulator
VAEYRIDELARAAGTSVRNVRVYQERGLLPPPRRVGRTGLYADAHLARLRLIRLLLQRGYTFATIGELIDAWSAGQGIAELLGLDEAIAVPWTDETPEVKDQESLRDGNLAFSAEDLRRAAALGLISFEGDDVVVPSPRLLEAGGQLVAAGVPLPAVLDIAEELMGRLSEVARLMFRLFDSHIAQETRPATEVAESLMQLRPLAKQTVDALLSIALEQESQQLLERRAERSRRMRSHDEAGTRSGQTPQFS